MVLMKLAAIELTLCAGIICVRDPEREILGFRESSRQLCGRSYQIRNITQQNANIFYTPGESSDFVPARSSI